MWGAGDLKTWDFRQPEWYRVATRRTVELPSMASLTTAIFSGVRTVFTLPPFVFSVEPVASKFRTQVLMAWDDGTARLRWILNSLRNSRRAIKKLSPFGKTLSQQKHVVLQSTAPLQLKRFKVGSKMAIAASAPVLPNQKKNSVAKSPDSLTHPV